MAWTISSTAMTTRSGRKSSPAPSSLDVDLQALYHGEEDVLLYEDDDRLPRHPYDISWEEETHEWNLWLEAGASPASGCPGRPASSPAA